MSKITPFLWFDTQAEEAMNFYVSVFKNSKAGSVSRGPDGKAFIVNFELDGQEFMGLNAGPQFKFNEAVSFVVNCDTQEEIDHYWDHLTADGGQEAPCGWLKDKFGLWWQVVPSNIGQLLADTEKGERAGKALMKMKKLIKAELENA